MLSLLSTPAKPSRIMEENILGIQHKKSLLNVACGANGSFQFRLLQVEYKWICSRRRNNGWRNNTKLHGHVGSRFFSILWGWYEYFKFYALYDGLELCQALGISQLEVESDSPVVVHTLTRHETNNWRMFYAFHECSQLWLDFNKIKHIFQQANTVVDRLAD